MCYVGALCAMSVMCMLHVLSENGMFSKGLFARAMCPWLYVRVIKMLHVCYVCFRCMLCVC